MYHDYLSEVTEDVVEAIRSDYNLQKLLCTCQTRDEMESLLEDELYCEDSVTGNGSGSYTMSRYTAQQYVLADGVDYLEEAVYDGVATHEQVSRLFLQLDWEGLDILVRTYLLPMAISNAIDQLNEMYAHPTGDDATSC